MALKVFFLAISLIPLQYSLVLGYFILFLAIICQ